MDGKSATLCALQHRSTLSLLKTRVKDGEILDTTPLGVLRPVALPFVFCFGPRCLLLTYLQ